MREEFYEYSASPRSEKSQKIIYTVYNVLFIISVIALVIFLFLLMMTGDSGFVFLSCVTVIFGLALYLIRRKMLIYFDYTFIAGEMRIVRVINGKFRRKFLVFECKDVFLLGKVGSDSFEKLYATPQIKKRMATPNGFGAENQLYYVGVDIAGEKNIVIMECDEKMLSFIAAYAGKNAIEKDYGKEE